MIRKAAKIIGVILVAFLLFAVFQHFNHGSPGLVGAKSRIEVLAHRGVHVQWKQGTYDLATGCEATHIRKPTNGYIENTLDSIGAAFDYGATIVEIDIRRTGDNHLVVFHDYGLACRTNGSGDIRDRTLTYVKKLDIGYGYTYDGGKTFPFRGKGIGMMPTLEELLKKFPDQKFLIHDKDGSPKTAAILARIVGKLPSDKRQLLYYWGAPETLKDVIQPRVPEVKRLIAEPSEVKFCLLYYLKTFGLADFTSACRGKTVGMPLKYTRLLWGWPYRFLEKTQRADMPFYLVIDDEDDAKNVLKIPVDGIVTDHIETIGKYFNGK